MEKDEDRLTRRRWLVYVPATVAVMFASGIPFTFAVFGAALEERDVALVQPFVAGLGVRSFTAALAVVIGSVVLDIDADKLRPLGWIGVLLTVVHVLVGVGIQKLQPALVYWGNSLLGFGNGIFYIIGVIHLAAWIPEAPGLAMGLCFGSLGAGSILGSVLLQWMVARFGVLKSAYASTAILCGLFALSTLGLEMPPMTWDPRPSSEIRLVAARNDTGNKLGLSIFRHHQVYLLMVIIAAGTGPVYGFYTAFSNIASTLGLMSASMANTWFTVMNVVVLVGRFAGGYLVDFSGFRSGFFWSGSKNLTILILIVQFVASLFLGPSEVSSNVPLFLLTVGIYFLTFASISTLSAVLARHMFSPVNGGIVFGFSMASSGAATMTFALLMSSALTTAASYPEAHLSAFTDYNTVCTVISLVGVLAALAITTCKAALDPPASSTAPYGSA